MSWIFFERIQSNIFSFFWIQEQKPQVTIFLSIPSLFFENVLFFWFLSLSRSSSFYRLCCVLKKCTHPIINLIRTCMLDKRMQEKDLKFHSFALSLSLSRFSCSILQLSFSLSASLLLYMEEKTERISIPLSKYVYIHLKSV